MSNVLVLSLLPQAQSVHRECSPVCSSCNLPCRVGANYCFLFMSVGKKNKQTTKTSHVRLVNKRISGKSGEETHSHCSSFPMASPKTNLWLAAVEYIGKESARGRDDGIKQFVRSCVPPTQRQFCLTWWRASGAGGRGVGGGGGGGGGEISNPSIDPSECMATGLCVCVCASVCLWVRQTVCVSPAYVCMLTYVT